MQASEGGLAASVAAESLKLREAAAAIGSSLAALGSEGAAAAPSVQQALGQQGRLLTTFAEVRPDMT